ncbi:MAG: 4Fe-4S dicluster domain-containing protein [Deltaproteobacteria bacterium]|nr:4Fe-4S dicluster domain-containing protein [Deltaproteobacteria bacterium]
MSGPIAGAPNGEAPTTDRPQAPSPEQAIRPDGSWLARVEEASGVKAGACYGCKKCSNGCPLGFAMDLHPYQVVRYLQLGQMDKLEGSATVWICASCQTCLTRCPNQVDLPRLMDWLKEELVRRGQAAPEQRVRLFHQTFLKSVAKRGRVFEGEMMATYMLKTGGAFGSEAIKNARLGLTMLKKGRMKLLPERVKDRRWLKALFKEPKGGSHA